MVRYHSEKKVAKIVYCTYNVGSYNAGIKLYISVNVVAYNFVLK